MFRRIDYIFNKLKPQCANLIITDNENYAVVLSSDENSKLKLIEKTDILHLKFLLATAKELNRNIIIDSKLAKSIYDNFKIYDTVDISNDEIKELLK